MIGQCTFVREECGYDKMADFVENATVLNSIMIFDLSFSGSWRDISFGLKSSNFYPCSRSR